MSKNEVNRSETRREDWGTPIDLFVQLRHEHSFVVDLCASKENSLCGIHYIDEATDIFSIDADMTLIGINENHDELYPYAWINPPYRPHGETGRFVTRAVELCKEHGLGLVALVPASVGTVWWRESVVPFFDFWISVGRLQFQGAPSTAQFDCAVCVMGAPGENWVGTTLAHESLGVAYKRFGA